MNYFYCCTVHITVPTHFYCDQVLYGLQEYPLVSRYTQLRLCYFFLNGTQRLLILWTAWLEQLILMLSNSGVSNSGDTSNFILFFFSHSLSLFIFVFHYLFFVMITVPNLNMIFCEMLRVPK